LLGPARRFLVLLGGQPPDSKPIQRFLDPFCRFLAADQVADLAAGQALAAGLHERGPELVGELVADRLAEHPRRRRLGVVPNGNSRRRKVRASYANIRS
jgi:hypothetical protein